MSQPDHCAHEGALAEFTALRSEIELWTTHSNTLHVTQMTFCGAIFAFAFSSSDRLILLLTLPLVSLILFRRHYQNTLEVARLALYIRAVLSPRVPDGLGWETWMRRNPGPTPASQWLTGNVATFAGPALLGVAVSYNAARTQPMLLVLWVLGLLCTGLLVWLIARGSPVVAADDRLAKASP